jgi:hypothetical protein
VQTTEYRLGSMGIKHLETKIPQRKPVGGNELSELRLVGPQSGSAAAQFGLDQSSAD